MNRSSIVTLAALALMVCGVGACHTASPRSGSNSNWLGQCGSDLDCDEGSCQCGVCTRSCEGTDHCASVSAGARCADALADSLCPDRESPELGLCLLPCDSARDCVDAVGEGARCEQGACVGPLKVVVTPGPDAGMGEDGAVRPADAAVAQRARGFSDCEALLAYATSHARELIEASPTGAPFSEPSECALSPICDQFPTEGEFVLPDPVLVPMDASAKDHGGQLQVRGGMVYAQAGGSLFRLSAAGDGSDLALLPAVTGPAASLFVGQARALLITTGRESASLVEVDLSDPGEMRVVARRELVGRALGVAQFGSRVRVVLQARPRLDWEIAGEGGALGSIPSDDPQAVAAARESNLEKVDRSTAQDWLPVYRDLDADGEPAAEAQLMDCSDVWPPERRSGVSLVTLVDIDLDQGMSSSQAVALFAEAATVLTSGSQVWIGTLPWQQLSDGWVGASAGDPQTLLHRFSAPLRAFEPQGVVTLGGHLVDVVEQSSALAFAVFGDRRGWPSAPQSEQVQLAVSALQWDGDALTNVGSSEPFGLVRPRAATLSGDTLLIASGGNDIQARALDVSDPSAPAVGDEVDIRGPWVRLVPLPDGRVVAFGRAVDPDWNYDAARSYVKVVEGTRITASIDLGRFQPDVAMAAQYNWDGAANTLVTCGSSFSGSLVSGIDCLAFDLQPGGERQLGRIAHPEPQAANAGYRWITSALIDQGSLLTLSSLHLRINQLPTMTPSLELDY